MNALRIFALAALACPAAAARASSFTVDSWSLSAGVVADWPNISVVRFTSIENPFENGHATGVFNSTAASSYSFAWNEAAGTGNFLIEGQHTAQGVGNGILQSASSGGITIDVSTDLLLTVQASYDYFLPLDISLASIGLNVVTPGGGVPPLLSVSDIEDAFPNIPASGTLSLDAQVVLPGGHSWLIQYGMNLKTIAPPGGLATGDGFIQFTLAPVPDPAIALLLLAVAPIALRRRRS